jgi:hypothetical protein
MRIACAISSPLRASSGSASPRTRKRWLNSLAAHQPRAVRSKSAPFLCCAKLDRALTRQGGRIRQESQNHLPCSAVCFFDDRCPFLFEQPVQPDTAHSTWFFFLIAQDETERKTAAEFATLMQSSMGILPKKSNLRVTQSPKTSANCLTFRQNVLFR